MKKQLPVIIDFESGKRPFWSEFVDLHKMGLDEKDHQPEDGLDAGLWEVLSVRQALADHLKALDDLYLASILLL